MMIYAIYSIIFFTFGIKPVVRGNNFLDAALGVTTKNMCCIEVYEDIGIQGDHDSVCSCRQTCVNLEAEWRNRISSFEFLSLYTLDVTLYSELNCHGDNLFIGNYEMAKQCNGEDLRKLGDSFLESIGYSKGCEKDFNDKTKSVLIKLGNTPSQTMSEIGSWIGKK